MIKTKTILVTMSLIGVLTISVLTGLTLKNASEKGLLGNPLPTYTTGEIESEFQSRLKEKGLPYTIANLIKIKKTNGNYSFSIVNPTNRLDAVKLKNKLGDLKTLFINLMRDKKAETINIDKIEETIKKTQAYLDSFIGVSEAFELQLLHFSDIDGGGNILSNVQKFSALVNKFKKDYPNNTLLLSTGDNWIPGPEYEVANDPQLDSILGVHGQGRGHVRFLNALGIKASVFGNHEWDQGPSQIAKIIKPEETEDKKSKWEGAMFPYLTTNLDFSSNADLKTLITKNGQDVDKIPGKLAGYGIVNVNNQKIGLIGATSNALDIISNLGNVRVTTGSLNQLASKIQSNIDALRMEGINKIILMGHMQQLSIEQQLAPLLDGVDIIIGGGSNTILADSNDKLWRGDEAAGTYPIILKDKSKKPVLVVNTDHDYTYLGRLVVNFDTNGVIQTNKLKDVINGAYKTDFNFNNNEYGLTENDVDPKIKEIANELNKLLDKKRKNIIGYTKVYINGDRKFVRTEETNFGDLSADANLYYAKKHDSEVTLAFKNGGGIRGPIGFCDLPAGSTDIKDLKCNPPLKSPSLPGSQDGQITQLDIETSLRFNNGLVIANRVTPKILKGILENGFRRSVDVKTGYRQETGSFPQVAGMIVEYDLSQKAFKRVQKITIVDSDPNTEGNQSLVIVENGRIVEEHKNKSWKMVILDYNIPSSISASQRVALQQNTTGLPDDSTFTKGKEQAALAAYLRENHGTVDKAFNIPDNRDKPNQPDTRLIDLTPEGRIIFKKKVIAYTNVYLNNNDMYHGDPFPSRETNLGNLLTDALVFYGKKYDKNVIIGIANNGGIRSSIGVCTKPGDNTSCVKPPKSPSIDNSIGGEITDSDIEAVYPFNNSLYIIGLKPSQLKDIFVASYGSLQKFDPRIQVSGLKVEYDKSQKDKNNVVKKMTIIDSNPNVDGNQELIIWNNYQVVPSTQNRIFKVVIDSYTVSHNPISGFHLSGNNKIDLTKITTTNDIDDTFDAGYRRDSIAEYLKTKYATSQNAYNVEDKPGSIKDSSAFQRLIDGTPGKPPVVQKNVFGFTNVYLNKDYIYKRETNLGDLLSDALLEYAKKVDANAAMAVVNGGAVKASIGVCSNPSDKNTCTKPNLGEIDKGMIDKIYKYNNDVYIVNLTPLQIRDLLGSAMRPGDVKKHNPGLQVAGIIVEYNNNFTNKEDRIRKITIVDSNSNTNGNQNLIIWNHGQVVDAQKNSKFKLVIDSYSVTNKRKYLSTLNLDPSDKVNIKLQMNDGIDTTYAKGTVRDSIAEYLKTHYGTSNKAYNTEDKPISTSTFKATRLLDVTPSNPQPPVNEKAIGYTNYFLNRINSAKRETNLGNLLADALLEYGKQDNAQVKVAIVPSDVIKHDVGTCSASCVKPEGGKLTKTNLQSIIPTNYKIYNLQITAQQLNDILLADTKTSSTYHRVQVAGIKIEYKRKTTKVKKEWIKKMTLMDANNTVIWNDYAPANKNTKYWITTLKYIVDGSSGYDPIDLGTTPNKDLTTSSSIQDGDTTSAKGTIHDAIIEYVLKHLNTQDKAFDVRDDKDPSSYKPKRIIDIS